MNLDVKFSVSESDVRQIAEFLMFCDEQFIPRLSTRVDLSDYAQKIVRNAVRFEAWESGGLVGLVAVYFNVAERHGYVTSVSVAPGFAGRGVARQLLQQCWQHSISLGMQQIALKVATQNKRAIRLYKKIGMRIVNSDAGFFNMIVDFSRES